MSNFQAKETYGQFQAPSYKFKHGQRLNKKKTHLLIKKVNLI